MAASELTDEQRQNWDELVDRIQNHDGDFVPLSEVAEE